MKDTELNEILKRATVPERGADYWEEFPARVTAAIERRGHQAGAGRNTDTRVLAAPNASNTWSWAFALRFLGAKPALALGVAAVCLALGFVLGLWKGQRGPASDPQLAAVRKYFQEIQALFPNQLQAIVFDQQGTHLVLAQEPNLPASPPLYLKISGPEGSQRFVTFSGQQIRINGDICDVLADGRGGVLLVGRQLVWSSDQARAGSGPYRIEAKTLEAAS